MSSNDLLHNSYCYSTLHPKIHPQRRRLTCLWPGFSTAGSIGEQLKFQLQISIQESLEVLTVSPVAPKTIQSWAIMQEQ